MEFELPLFPLNTVLFPGMPLHLHIFEERYKQMIRTCLEKSRPFGVVLIEKGAEALGPPATPHEIGCTAQIVQVEPLEQGRMNIVAIGQERFQVRSLKHDKPYLVGNVALYPMEGENATTLARAGRRLRPWVERYLHMLADAGLLEFETEQLPGDALRLGYLGAALLQVPTEQKQSLLATEQAAAFLSEMSALYRREVALLEAMLALGVQDEANAAPFSLN